MEIPSLTVFTTGEDRRPMEALEFDIEGNNGVRYHANIATQKGADEFIQVCSTNFFSVFVEKYAKPARNRIAAAGTHAGSTSAKHHRRDAHSLHKTYSVISVLSAKASPAAFGRFDVQQIDSWLNYASSVLQKLAVDPQWTLTGVLQEYDLEMLTALCTSAHQKSVAVRMLEFHQQHSSINNNNTTTSVLNALSQFCASRAAPNMPSPAVAQLLTGLINNCKIQMFGHPSNDAGATKDYFFQQLERSGFLAQMLRLVTAPTSIPIVTTSVYKRFLDQWMENCTKIRKTFRRGNPTGNVLAAILQGRDGWTQSPRHPEITERLQALAQFCEHYADINTKDSRPAVPLKHCNYNSCQKLEFHEPLMACGRCKVTHYCSKECQRADWKLHKKTCVAPGMNIVHWMAANDAALQSELDRVARKRKLKKEELALELDFSSEAGVAPALKDNPDFKVGAVKDYLEGSRPAEPNWFDKGTSQYDSNIQKFLVDAQDHYSHVADHFLLIIIRLPNGTPYSCRIKYMRD